MYSSGGFQACGGAGAGAGARGWAVTYSSWVWIVGSEVHGGFAKAGAGGEDTRMCMCTCVHVCMCACVLVCMTCDEALNTS